MAQDERLTSSLQESVLTLLAFVEAEGSIVASAVTPDLFDGTYRQVAARVLDYRHRYGKPPGKEHVDDLFDDILSDPHNRQGPIYRRILLSMLQQVDGLNAAYVASRVTQFVRHQTLKRAVIEAATRYTQGGEGVEDDVENLLNQALKSRTESFDPGIFLHDTKRSLGFLDRSKVDAISLGIKELDELELVPARRRMWLLMGPKGSGKSWGMVHCGKRGLIQRKRVCHITLELDLDETVQRYYQSLYAIGKRDDTFKVTGFELDDLHRLVSLRTREEKPIYHLRDPQIEQYLLSRIDQWGLRLSNICIKWFPTRSLTIRKLLAYLDGLEALGFVPDLLIIDYPDIMWYPQDNATMAIGRLYEDLRGIAGERNLALAVATQTNRSGWTAGSVGGHHVGWDASKLMTADVVITYSQSIDEHGLGIARLWVDKGRSDRDKFTVAINQNYALGQWVLGSVPMSKRYWDEVKALTGGEPESDYEPGDQE